MYSVSEVARFLDVTPQLARTWVFGRASRASNGPGRNTSSVLIAPPTRIGGDSILSFRDLVELRFVRLFRHYGVSMPVIKAAAQNAANQLQSNHPFGMHRFYTDGKKIFTDLKDIRIVEEESGKDIDSKRLYQELDVAQMVMGEIIQVWIKDVEYDAGIIRQWRILGEGKRPVLDPLRGFGQPIDGPSGIPLSALFGPIRGGDSIQSVADWFEVPTEAVTQAIDVYGRYRLPH